MKARVAVCKWCEKEYAIKDSSASDRDSYCSVECQEEAKVACTECDKWVEEIWDAWSAYKAEYEPDEEEENPHFVDDTVCERYPRNRRMYLEFRRRYQSWRAKHCWKASFWAWDGRSNATFSGGSGCSYKAGLNIVVFCLVIWLGWTGVKCGWNWMFGSGSKEVTSEDMMKAWQKHLEQRREAFEDGMSENEVEAKGLTNYTWEEWQPNKTVTEKSGNPSVAGVAVVSDKVKKIGDAAKAVWQNISTKIDENPELELKKRNARLAASESDEKVGAPQQAAVPKVEDAMPVAPGGAALKPVVSGGDTSNGMRRASVDSKRIACHVQGKGSTEGEALLSAFRLAVMRCVATWVDSKSRMNEKRDELIAIRKTITQADIARFEIENTEQKDGLVVVKVKVSVSKKQIAAKFAKVFPDVFSND